MKFRRLFAAATLSSSAIVAALFVASPSDEIKQNEFSPQNAKADFLFKNTADMPGLFRHGVTLNVDKFVKPLEASISQDITDAFFSSVVDLNGPNYLHVKGLLEVDMYGISSFCKRYQEACEDHSSPADQQNFMFVDDELLQKMKDINLEVNHSILGRDDKDQYDDDDYWDYPTSGYGDCEDFVMAKEQLFATRLGIPTSFMSMVAVQSTRIIDGEPVTEGHAVFGVKTNLGLLVFDNLNDEVLLPYETGYKFEAVAQFNSFRNWYALEEVKPPVDAKDDKIAQLINAELRPSFR